MVRGGSWNLRRGDACSARVALRIVDGDLLDQNVDAIVNAWNRNIIPWWLLIPQGVSGAIKRRGGVRPFRELGGRPLPLGHARHTSAGRLDFGGIIHVAAIDGWWRASELSIRESTRSALQLAKSRGYRSLALPLLGSGSGGFDEGRSEQIMTDTLQGELPLDVVLVRFRRALDE